MNKEKETKEERDLWCHYSDLPSPLAYTECMDFDSMGNHGRFPKGKEHEQEQSSVRRVENIISGIFLNGKSK